jgi:hypothetical protein
MKAPYEPVSRTVVQPFDAGGEGKEVSVGANRYHYECCVPAGGGAFHVVQDRRGSRPALLPRVSGVTWEFVTRHERSTGAESLLEGDSDLRALFVRRGAQRSLTNTARTWGSVCQTVSWWAMRSSRLIIALSASAGTGRAKW